MPESTAVMRDVSERRMIFDGFYTGWAVVYPRNQRMLSGRGGEFVRYFLTTPAASKGPMRS